jgi:hypothetical protein
VEYVVSRAPGHGWAGCGDGWRWDEARGEESTMTVEGLASRVDRLQRAEERNVVSRTLVWALCGLVLAAEVLWICAVMGALGVRPFTLPPPHTIHQR